MQAGNLGAAILDVKTALQQDADNALGRRLLGEIHYRQRNFPAASVELERSLALSPDPEVAGLYAEVLVAAGKSQGLVELYQQGFFDDAGDNAAFLAALSRAQAITGDGFAAEQTLSRVRTLAPDSRELLFAEAVLVARHDGDLEQLETLLQQLTQAFPDFEEGWSLHANLAVNRGDLPTAETSLVRALELNPYRADDRLLLANILLDRESLDRAGEELQRLLEAAPEHPGVLYAEARLQVERENTGAALATLQRLLAIQPDHIAGLYLAGLVNAHEGNLATAEMQLSRFLSERPDHVNARLLRASIDVQQGDPERARSIAREILADDPQNMSARKVLAASAREASRQSREPAVTAEELAGSAESAGSTAPGGSDVPARQQIDVDAAQERVGEDLRRDPDNLQGLLRLAAVHAQRGEFDAMVVVLRRAVSAHPEAPEPRLVLARYLLQQGDLEAGVALLRQLPDHPRVLLLLARIELSRNDVSAAEGFLNRVLALEPENETARKLLLETLRQQGKSAQAREMEAFWARPGAASTPALHEAAAGYLSQGAEELARMLYERLYTLVPEDVVVVNNLAWVERDKDPKRALQLVERALQAVPGHAGILDTKAMILLHQGRLDDALEVNRLSLEATPVKPLYRVHRARILVAAGEDQAAREVLGEVLSGRGDFEGRAEAEALLDELN